MFKDQFSVHFGSLTVDVDQECQVRHQSGSDWSHMGQIRDFYSTFWLISVLKSSLKSQSDQLW